ncbi:MAG: hypothetical protein WAO52_09920 [Prolixibacteraceae bacterium]
MKHFGLLFLIFLSFGTTGFAQKMTGYGGELSIISIKPNVRIWFSKTFGVEAFGGPAIEIADLRPNDLEAGFKLLKAIQYRRTDRTYFGFVGKWKWVNNDLPDYQVNLPVPGFIIGKEWYSKRIKRKAFAVELGYQYGVKRFDDANGKLLTSLSFEEFPLILNLRYSFYHKWR